MIASPAWAQLGTTDIIASTGDAAADGNGLIDSFNNSQGPMLNDAGQIAYTIDLYSGTTLGTADDTSINLFFGGVNQIIAREGDAAPNGNGVMGGFTASSLKGIGTGGTVLFDNVLTGTALGLADNSGLYQGAISGITSIAREGDSAPGVTGDWNAGFSGPAVGGTAAYTFRGTMTNTPGGFTDDGYLARAFGTNVTIVGQEGDAVPDGNGTFAFFSDPFINASGQIAFQSNSIAGTLGGINDDKGVFKVNLDGSITQLAREGQTVQDGNGEYSNFGSRNPINKSGRVVFQATLRNTSGGSGDDSGIYTSSSGSVTQIVREGQPAPDGNGIFNSLSAGSMQINDSNRVAFSGTLIGTVNGFLDNAGLFTGSGSTITQILREGTTVPDGNGTFLSVVSNYSINNSGVTASEWSLTNTSNGASDNSILVLADGIDVITVAREGDAFEGSTITGIEIEENTSMQSSSLNEKGQLAYWVSLLNGEEVIAMFTPALHWRNAGSGSWSSSGNWTLGIAPDALYDVSIDPSAGLNVTGPFSNTTVKSLTLGSTTTGVASLSLTNNGDLSSINAVNVNARGLLNLGSGRTLTAPTLNNSGVVQGRGQIDATLSNASTGQVLVGSGDQLIFSAGSNTNNGLIEVIGGEVKFTQDLTNAASTGLITGRDATMRFTGGLTNDGAIAISFGTSDVHGPITNAATGSVVVSGNANVTFYDDISNIGVINVSTGSTAVFFGDLTGNGVGGAGTVFLEGDTRPGFSPGVMSFGGNVHLGFFSGLTTELGGLTPGAGHDQLAVAGDVTLGGTLDITGFGGFTLTPGMVFEIITFGGNLSGSFNDIVNSTGLNGLILSVSSDADSVNLLLEALAGDLNLDGFVGVDDLNIVLLNWNQNVDAGVWQTGDPTGDGFVGVDDLNQVLVNWNAGTPPGGPGNTANIPEPGTALLLGSLGAGLLRRKRKAC